MKIVILELNEKEALKFCSWLIAQSFGTIGLTYSNKEFFETVIIVQAVINDPEGYRLVKENYSKQIKKEETI